ncbi:MULTISPECIES: DUF4383 domain-containing protein [unclassified Streptomyces]|uniref:DUF4383 domain-containing protein n=1 Tax=unclassified Streptomyces TaxID=2593676 RepID=UPI0036E1F6AB
MQLRDELPVDHQLATVYRYGAAFCGVVLLIFGSLGFADQLSPFGTDGDTIAGMTTNGVLSLISVVVGLALIAGAAIGGNFASTLFSFVMGLMILTFGMYGRVTSRLPHDNPYWRRRHPRQAAEESLARRRRAAAAIDSADIPATALPGTATNETGR